MIVQRYKFNSCQHATSETVAEYVAALLKLAEHCNFEKTLDEMLRDRLVCGITNPAVQKHLLSEPELTFTKVVTITQVLELAEKGSKDLQSSTVKDLPKDIHKFSHVPNFKNSSQTRKDVVASDRTPTDTCYCCGGKQN